MLKFKRKFRRQRFKFQLLPSDDTHDPFSALQECSCLLHLPAKRLPWTTFPTSAQYWNVLIRIFSCSLFWSSRTYKLASPFTGLHSYRYQSTDFPGSIYCNEKWTTYKSLLLIQEYLSADTNGRAVWGVRRRPFAFWDRIPPGTWLSVVTCV